MKKDKIEKLAKKFHSKLVMGIVGIAILGLGYITGKSYQYNTCNLNQVFAQRSFTSPSLNHLVSDTFNDNIGQWNTSDTNSDPTSMESDSDSDIYYKSLWFNHGKLGLDNLSVWISDMIENPSNNWSDRSDKVSSYSFAHNNKLDPSDKLPKRYANTSYNIDFTKEVNKCSDKINNPSDKLNKAPDTKYITYHVNNNHHNLTLTLHQPKRDIGFKSVFVKSVTYHLESIYGVYHTRYRFKPINIKTFDGHNHKQFVGVHNIKLTKSSCIYK